MRTHTAIVRPRLWLHEDGSFQKRPLTLTWKGRLACLVVTVTAVRGGPVDEKSPWSE